MAAMCAPLIALDVGPLSLALRDGTQELHRRLERALRLTDLGLTLDAYRIVIEAFLGFYAPLEALLAMVAAESGGAVPMHGRAKLWRLRADLRALGSSDADIEALPRCGYVPEMTTPARAMGGLYVVEGATLGGRVIVRALRDHLGIDHATGAAFFDGYGVETGPMWRTFVAHMDSSPWPRAETAAAAIDTFLAFERWLGEQGALG
jgi:heme oxygenase (biliverdin-IX-beta and delta-forming)